MTAPASTTAPRNFIHQRRSLLRRIMYKTFALRNRPKLCLAPFTVFIFALGFLSGSEKQSGPGNTLIQEQLTPQNNLLDIVIIASSAHTSSHVRKTLESLNRAGSKFNIQLVHFTSTAQTRFADLDFDYTVKISRRPYDNPLRALSFDSPPALLITAGTVLAERSIQWLIDARRTYSNRPDIAAFVLDGVIPLKKHTAAAVDHDASSWRPIELPDESAFLFRSCPQATAILFNDGPAHFSLLETFVEWISLRRSDWYRFPSGPGIDNTPLGISALPERNWTRASWNVWFSKFLDEYQLSVVFPNLKGALVVNTEVSPAGVFKVENRLHNTQESWNFNRSARPLLGSGKLTPKSYFSDEAIRKIVNLGEEQGGVLAFTLVNKVFLDTTRSWLCNVDEGGFRPKGLLWAVTDAESNGALSQVKGSTTVWLDEVQGGKSTGHEFGNPGYWKLMLERTALITEILSHGIAVFAFETDAIWLKDPFPFINELVSQEADIVGTINTRMEVSGNFFYLRPTLATRRLWMEITSEFSKAYEKSHFDKKAFDSWTYIENDQSLLTKLVLRNETWRKSYPLSFLTLDMEKFVDGRWYKPEEGFYTSERARKPVVINNNFVIGVKEKTERAKKFGHWFWDESNEQCLKEVVRKAIRQ